MEHHYLKSKQLQKFDCLQFFRRSLLVILLLSQFCTRNAFSQSPGSASGVVVDQIGKPLKGVFVTTANSSTETDQNGKFILTSAKGSEVTFSHQKFYTKVVKVNNDDSMYVRLSDRYLLFSNENAKYQRDSTTEANKPYINILHGRQLLETSLQSIGYVGTNQLITTPSSNFLQALPGRIAGLDITFNNGGPGLDASGAWYSVRNSRGGNVILIDGVQRSFLSINPEQIESISVLKDALSTVMFGQRSSGGIVSIVTKKGDSGSPRLSFTAQTAIQTPVALPKPLNSWQYAALYNEANKNAGEPATYSTDDIYKYQEGTNPYTHPNVDWYNTVLKNQAIMNRYNFNVQGSGVGFRYYVDADYLTEGGLFKTIGENKYNTNAQLNRYLIRSNLGVDITKTTSLQINLLGRIQRNNEPGGGTSGIFNSLLNTPRGAYPVFNDNGSLGGNSRYAQNANIYGQTVKRGYLYNDSRDMSVDVQLKQNLDVITPGLFFSAQGSYNNSSVYLTTRAKNFAVYQQNAAGIYTTFLTSGTSLDQTSVGTPGVRSRVTYWEGLLGYNKTVKQHHIGATLVANQQSTLLYSAGNLPENFTDFAGKLTYDWNEKYMAEFAGSYAGYNRLAPAARWSTYYAFGLGWNVHKENFIKDNFASISNLKLRGTYGKTGFANTGYYTYLQTYISATANHSYYWWGENSSVIQSIYQGALTNPELQPEKANKLNLAVDLGLWDNRLSITAEYFKNKFYDVVMTPMRQTNVLGADAYPTQNIGEFNYTGTEISATYQNRVRNFNYFIAANFSTVMSKVIYNGEVERNYEWQRLTGKSVGVQEGYVATGLWQSQAEINNTSNAILTGTSRANLRPGDIRYQDLNSDGIIDNNDFGAIGKEKPVMYYGLTIGFNYHAFDFNMHVYGTGNRLANLNNDFNRAFGSTGTGNAYEYNLGRWTPETAITATQPRVWIGNNVNNTQNSTYWIKPANFWRVKNAEIGYTLPAAISNKIRVPFARVFINGQNLLTFSELFNVRDDIDPEAMGSAYPVMRAVNFGVNVKF